MKALDIAVMILQTWIILHCLWIVYSQPLFGVLVSHYRNIEVIVWFIRRINFDAAYGLVPPFSCRDGHLQAFVSWVDIDQRWRPVSRKWLGVKVEQVLNIFYIVYCRGLIVQFVLLSGWRAAKDGRTFTWPRVP
jgi:hypothetical protein